jgi:cell division protein FtsZ
VVATGIDQAASAAPRPVSVPEARLAELTHKLRADQQRLSERVERGEPRAAPPAASASAPASAHTPNSQAIESAAKAAVAAAVLSTATGDDVTIRPIQPKPSLFPEPAAVEREQSAPAAFVPPAPERPASRAPRMPRIEELPLPAQNELRALRGEAPASEPPEKRRMGLLQRLASVGLGGGRRDDNEPEGRPQIPMRPAPRAPERTLPRAAPRMPDSRPPEAISEYAKRPPHQTLDPHGRAPVNNSIEEDHLDIPAFLRRQAN